MATTLPILGGMSGRWSGQSFSSERWVVVVDVRREDAAQMALVEDYDVVEALAAKRTDTRSTKAFCQGERRAVTTSVIPIASTCLRKFSPHEASRSRSR